MAMPYSDVNRMLSGAHVAQEVGLTSGGRMTLQGGDIQRVVEIALREADEFEKIEAHPFAPMAEMPR